MAKSHLHHVWLVAILQWAGAATAADVSELPPVEVRGSYDNAVGSSDAASQGAVNREVILNRPLLRPAELLENVPGLIVTQHSGDGKANQYFLRGYNLDHGTDFATWVAGMPVNMPTHVHGQGYTDLNFIIPELVSRVLYTKGPYFAEDGDFAAAGTARISYAEILPGHIATVTTGQLGYRRSVLAGSPELAAGRMVYGLEYQHADGPWVNPSGFHKLSGVLRYAQGSSANGFNITAMTYRAGWNATDQIPLRAVNDGTVSRYGAIDPTDGGQSSRHSLSGEWRFAEGNVTRAASVYAIRSSLNLFSNFTYFLNNPLNGDQFEQAEKRLVLGAAAHQTWYSKLDGRQMWNTLGLQIRRDRLSPVALYNTRAQQFLSATREDSVNITSVAPYFSNTVMWTGWLRSISGLRADSYGFDVSSNRAANSGKARDAMISPKLSLIAGPWANTEYFINYGRGFHSNDARGTTITVDPVSGAPAQRVAPLVRTIGYEAGVRSEMSRGLTLSASAWQLAQGSELLFVGDAGTTEPSRPSKRTGLEVLVQYLPRPGIAMDGSLALTRARFRDIDPAGNYIPGSPNRVASVGITADAHHGWSGALRWRYFGQRPLTENNGVRSASTAMVNARLGYAFTKSLKLQLDAFNLLNRKNNDIDYFYPSQLAGEAAPVADVHLHPVEKRAFRLSMTASY
jgi:hypothetical protein